MLVGLGPLCLLGGPQGVVGVVCWLTRPAGAWAGTPTAAVWLCADVRVMSCVVCCCRADVTMTSPFMDAYVQLLIKTCHTRGVHAMGGMAAQIPIKNDPAANEAALNKVGVQSAC